MYIYIYIMGNNNIVIMTIHHVTWNNIFMRYLYIGMTLKTLENYVVISNWYDVPMQIESTDISIDTINWYYYFIY